MKMYNNNHGNGGRQGSERKRQHFTTSRNSASRYGNDRAERVTSSDSYSTDRSYNSYSTDRSYSDKPARERSEGRSSYRSEGRSYGSEGRSYGSRNGEGRSYSSEGRSRNSEGRSYGSRNSEGRSYGSRNSEGRSYSSEGRTRNTEGRSYGSRNSEGRSFGSRNGGSYGSRSAKPSYQRKPYSRKDDAVIDAMIARTPQPEINANSDNDYAKSGISETVRLNRYIANSGVCSRREADKLIQAGVVTVNGEVVTELGVKVNVLTDEVKFNGERLKGEDKVYIVMNKPKGYVTTASDPHADKTVMDLLHGCKNRVFPVGRLDKNTTGVLMFTNDGELSERLTHPSFNKKKIYQVIVDHPLAEEDKEKIKNGVELNDGIINADELEYVDAHDHRRLGIEIHSGKNRIVRRIFESLGYEVKALDRVYFAGLTKKGLKKGEWRYLTEGEINVLRMGAFV